MASQVTDIQLQLKDIIQIVAPSDPDLHMKRYVIEYIDSFKIKLISVDDLDAAVLNITIGKSGVLDNNSITGIYLLSRDDTCLLYTSDAADE